MPAPSSHGVVPRLETKPRSTLIPYIVDVFVADLPVGSARVVARYDTRTGQVWRTSGPSTHVSLDEIHDEIEASRR